MNLSSYDIDILWSVSGIDRPVVPGAAMWNSIELLRKGGYVQGYSYVEITDKGRQFLKEGIIRLDINMKAGDKIEPSTTYIDRRMDIVTVTTEFKIEQ